MNATATKASRLIATIAAKVGINKGAPRVWLQGELPARAGFKPKVRYSVEHGKEGDARIVLKIDENGTRVVSSKGAESDIPVIDLNSKELLSKFDGMNAVRVILMDGAIHVLPAAVEIKKQDRRKRLESALESGVITTASVAHGLGVLSNAYHAGMKAAGLKPSLLWACEYDNDYINQAARANDAWDENTIALSMPLQDLAFTDEYTLNRLPRPILLEAGLPCTAASIAGKSKKHLKMAEDDENAGHLVAAFIALIAKVNPVLISLENVVAWYRTASASILRTQLKELGYNVQEVEIDGGDFAIEARKRQVLIAVTEGIEFNLAEFVAPPREAQKLSEILEPIGPDDSSWSTMSYLFAKQERDKADGKGFAMQIHTPESTRVGCIGSGYAKVRSTEPKLAHPTDSMLLRQLTAKEHAACKGIPTHLLDGLTSTTIQHEMLGNSVIWPAFKHLGEFLGRTVSKGFTAVADKVTEVVEPKKEEVSMPLFAAA